MTNGYWRVRLLRSIIKLVFFYFFRELQVVEMYTLDIIINVNWWDIPIYINYYMDYQSLFIKEVNIYLPVFGYVSATCN